MESKKSIKGGLSITLLLSYFSSYFSINLTSIPLPFSPPTSKTGIFSKIPFLVFFHSSFNNSLYSLTLYYTSIELLFSKLFINSFILVYCNGNFFHNFIRDVKPYSIEI